MRSGRRKEKEEEKRILGGIEKERKMGGMN
jgi:hypothetical protein